MKKYDDVDAAGLTNPRFRDGTNRNKQVSFDLSAMSGAGSLIVPWSDNGMDAGSVYSPRAYVFRSADQAITSNTLTAIIWQGQSFNVGNLWNNVSNQSRLTAPIGGVYQIGADVAYNNTAGDNCRYALFIRKNGVTYIAGVDMTILWNGACELQCSTIQALVATDYLEVIAFHIAGANRNVVWVSGRSPVAWMLRVA